MALSRWGGAAAAILFGSALLVGCGTGSKAHASSGSSSTTSTTAAGRNGAAFQAYRTCLSQHGVNVPDVGRGQRPQGGSGADPTPRTAPSLPAGVTQQQFQAAQQACASLRPTGGFGGANGGGVRNSAAFRAYLSCLADHGVPVSTTTSTTAPVRQGQLFDRNDPHFAAANQVCMALLPTPSSTTTVAS
jgi:hypothetical protein